MDCGIWSRFHNQLSNRPCDDNASGYCGMRISCWSEFGVVCAVDDSSCDEFEASDTSNVRNAGLSTVSIYYSAPVQIPAKKGRNSLTAHRSRTNKTLHILECHACLCQILGSHLLIWRRLRARATRTTSCRRRTSGLPCLSRHSLVLISED